MVVFLKVETLVYKKENLQYFGSRQKRLSDSWRSAIKGYFHLNACSLSLISHFLFVLFLLFWLRFAAIVKALLLKSLFIREDLIIKSHR